MAALSGSNDGTFGDVRENIVPPPPSGKRRIIRTITIYNPNGTAQTVFVAYKNLNDERVIVRTSLAANKTLVLGDTETLILDAINKCIVGYTTSTPGTELDYTAHWGESA